MILNEYENKKNSKIGLLIEQLKKQNVENDLKEMKKAKRDRYKKNIKIDIPNFDENTMYTIEIFKFMNKYIDRMSGRIQSFGVIKEGIHLLQIALNSKKSEEQLDIISEASVESVLNKNNDFGNNKQGRKELKISKMKELERSNLYEGDTAMPMMDSHDFINEKKPKAKQIYTLNDDREERKSENEDTQIYNEIDSNDIDQHDDSKSNYGRNSGSVDGLDDSELVNQYLEEEQ